MLDPRRAVFAVITAVVVVGTTYSVIYHTYLDTSNPLITHLPHPLGKTHYFANKGNILNVYFIKKAWGWTTLLFFFSWLTSSPSTRTGGRVLKWVIATSVWVIFTMWFFGSPLFERVTIASGGTCMVYPPSGSPVTIPTDYCITRTAVSQSSGLFDHIQDFVPLSPGWKAFPRLRGGVDISGHIFLLTLSTLFLADQLRPSLSVQHWTIIHGLAVLANLLLVGIWLFAIGTTSVYFHSPREKIIGYIFGILGFLPTQLVQSGAATATAHERAARVRSD